MTPTMSSLLQLTLPLVTGVGTFLALKGLSKVNVGIAGLDPTFKRVVVLALAFVFTNLAKLAGVPSVCSLADAESCLGALTPEALQTLVAALVATGVHHLTKTRPAA